MQVRYQAAPRPDRVEIIAETGAVRVHWNRRYEPASIARDTRVKKSLLDKDIEANSFNANLLFEPWTISNKQGKPFQVFTPFWKTCLAHAKIETPLAKPTPTRNVSNYKNKFKN